MRVFPKIRENPQIIHFDRVWNHYKPSILGPPIFGNTHKGLKTDFFFQGIHFLNSEE